MLNDMSDIFDLTFHLGGFGIAMAIVTIVGGIGSVVTWRRYQRSSAGFSALGAAILMLWWRIVGGGVGLLLGMIAWWRNEPGGWVLGILIGVNVLILFPMLFRMTKKALRI